MSNLKNLKNLRTAKEIAPLLGRTTRAIQMRAANGEIPCYKIGGTYLYDIEEIKKWVESKYQPATNEIKTNEGS